MAKKIRDKKPLWAVWGNRWGLRGPLRVFWNDSLQSWWCGEESISESGFQWNAGCFSFSTRCKKEVLAFIRGYRACGCLIANVTTHNGKALTANADED